MTRREDVNIKQGVPRCEMRFETADGRLVQCCGQSSLFRLPRQVPGKQQRNCVLNFIAPNGGDSMRKVTDATKHMIASTRAQSWRWAVRAGGRRAGAPAPPAAPGELGMGFSSLDVA